MPKLPKFTDLTANVPGMLGKFKTLLDSFTGPGAAPITEEALAKETDPLKIKFMEVELLINQLTDIQVIQARTINTLKNTYAELQKLIASPTAPQQVDESSTADKKQETVVQQETASDKPTVDDQKTE